MEAEMESLRGEALAAISAVRTAEELDAARVRFTGRSGALTKLSEGMRTVSKDDKPRIGKALNELREAVGAALDERLAAITTERDAAALSGIDTTLPGILPELGSIHPLTTLQDRAIRIFRRMGFSLADGPDIETEWHCFDALNTPADHPARNEQDTFFLPDGRVLRTHTSSVQVRTMETQPPPVRIIAPGSAYRRDEVDATHLAQFTQMEGLHVAERVTLADLKGTLEFFFRELLGEETRIRFRPHFFPFTEPSYEIDIRAAALGGKWMELAGCGMVDPAVFERICDRRQDRVYDPETVTGFAFGFGLDRLAMNLTGVSDIRTLVENDLRFLKQF